MANFKKPLAAALGAAVLVTAVAPLASASSNPFFTQQLSAGYDLANQQKTTEGKCGEGSCGAGKNGEGKCGEGKCGEGKCGNTKAHTESSDDKAAGEGSCGGAKAGSEGKCGGK